jgi:hypothetical protein
MIIGQYGWISTSLPSLNLFVVNMSGLARETSFETGHAAMVEDGFYVYWRWWTS